MATQSTFITKVIATGSLVLAAALITPTSMNFHGFAANAFAEEDGGSHESGGTKGHKGQGGESDKGKGGSSKGKGGKDAVYQGDSENHQKGKSDTSGNKGKPVWASEGIPEGDYGRLNVARAPQHTRDQALAEALSTVTDWSLYTKTLTEAIAAISTYRTIPIVRVDSPTQSLALYQALLRDGKISAIGDNGSNIVVEAAIFLASASDKTKPITEETVIAMNTILGVKTPGGLTDAAFAEQADAVRAMILVAHDAVVPVPVPYSSFLTSKKYVGILFQHTLLCCTFNKIHNILMLQSRISILRITADV